MSLSRALQRRRKSRPSAARSADDKPPESFVTFTRDWLGVTLEPGQRVLARVAFDGLEPCDLLGEERAIARRLFGDVETVPEHARGVLVAVCGARAGKSYVLCGLRMLHLAMAVPLGVLAPGEEAVASLIGPRLRHAKHVLRYVAGAVRACARLAKLIVRDTADMLSLRRSDGYVVSVEALPAAKGGEAGRGRSLVGAALDESAFFYDSDHVVNDVEVYRAVAPRIVRGGQVVVASTPWTEAGLLYDFHKRNFGGPQDAVVVHAPTLLLRDTEETRAIVERERIRDDLNARREFDAQFLPVGGNAFFSPVAIDAAVDATLELPATPHEHAIVAVGADFGFRRDSSALCSVHRMRDLYIVGHLLELRPTDAPLRFSETVATFADAAYTQGAQDIMADMHYREAIAEHLRLHDLGLVDAPTGAEGKSRTYQVAKALLNEGRVRLPDNERLIRQLKEITVRPLPGGGVSIQAPRTVGSGHGDLVSAFVLALFKASQQYVPPELPASPEPGSPEWVAEQEAIMLEQAEARVRERNRKRRRR